MKAEPVSKLEGSKGLESERTWSKNQIREQTQKMEGRSGELICVLRFAHSTCVSPSTSLSVSACFHF